MQKYVFKKHSPEYSAFFATEKKKLAKTLGSSAKIEHVGSTAVPGLGGKGILDIVIGVQRSKFAEAKRRLEQAGYEFREKASYPERWFFRIDYPHRRTKRRVHLHLTRLNGRDWQDMIGFRDYLLKHPDAVKRYAVLKKEGVKIARGVGEEYRKHKEAFIQSAPRKKTRSMKK